MGGYFLSGVRLEGLGVKVRWAFTGREAPSGGFALLWGLFVMIIYDVPIFKREKLKYLSSHLAAVFTLLHTRECIT